MSLLDVHGYLYAFPHCQRAGFVRICPLKVFSFATLSSDEKKCFGKCGFRPGRDERKEAGAH
eukprot:scaffold16103_cov17-Tisochrysis_lutea.AAC.1